MGPDGTVYTTDQSDAEVQAFSATGVSLDRFGTAGTGNGQFNTTQGIAVSAAGRMYVTDSHRVQYFERAATGTSVSVSMDEDGVPTAFDLTLCGGDQDGTDTITWSISGAASHGTAIASGTGPFKAIAYTPTADYNGMNSFVVQIADGNGGTDTMTVNVTIAPLADAPVITQGAGPLAVTMSEDGSPTAFAATVGATHGDGDTMTWSASSPATNGTATVSGTGAAPSTFTYVPTANYNGMDSFTIQVSDGNMGIDTIAVNVTVSPQNDPPVITQGAGPLSVTMDEDSSPTAFVAPTLGATDEEMNTLTWSVSSAASNGAATVSGSGASPSNVTYVPNANFSGMDSFTIQVSDGDTGTDTIAVNVTVSPANDVPVITQGAGPLTVTMDEDGSPTAFVAPTLGATDVDGNTLTWSVSSAASNGTATVNGMGAAPTTFAYVPNANFNGMDSFTIKVSDGNNAFDTIDVNVTVSPQNDAPVITQGPGPLDVTMYEDASPTAFVAPALSATDTEGNPLTWTLTSAASNGTATVSGTGTTPGTFSYAPNADFNGTDAFTIQVADGNAGIDTIVVNITVTARNDGPVVTTNTGFTVTEGGTVALTTSQINGSDVDDGAMDLTYTVTTNSATGQLERISDPGNAITSFTQADLSNGLVQFAHDGGESAADSFAFALADGGENGATPVTGTVNITVTPTNDAPILAAIGAKEVDENGTLQFTLSATDAENDGLTYDAANLPGNATFDTTTRTFTWTPSYDTSGAYPDVLFRVTDDGMPPLSDTESISITVGDVNRTPVLNAVGDQEIDENMGLSFTLGGNDPDGDNLTYTAANLPMGSSFEATTATFSWSPGFDEAGVYTDVQFTVTDDGTPPQSDTETITITVGNVNRMPVLDAVGSRQIDEGTTLTFMVTATDLDDNTLMYSMDNAPDGANFDATTQSFTWTPDYGAAGIYDVLFLVTDDGTPAETDSETVTITVGDINRSPVLAPVGNRSVDEGNELAIVLTGSDPDGDGLTFEAIDAPEAASFDTMTQTFTWTPGAEASGMYDRTLGVTDDGNPPTSVSQS